ncbi:MAG: hypothetical protein ACLFTK_15370 [Anaerolineales bacterium]
MLHAKRYTGLLLGVVLALTFSLVMPLGAQEDGSDGDGQRSGEDGETAPPAPPPDDGAGAAAGFTAAETLDELIAEYEGLGDYVASIEDAELNDINFEELYGWISTIYDDRGATGVAVFLDESGMLDLLGVPVSYVDLLLLLEDEGFDAAVVEGDERGLISEEGELTIFIELESEEVSENVSEMLAGLGASTYEYTDLTNELRVGIPVAILQLAPTPPELMQLLATSLQSVTAIEGVVGYRVPEAELDLDLEDAGS